MVIIKTITNCSHLGYFLPNTTKSQELVILAAKAMKKIIK
jgi:hypothetical protein